MVTPWVSILEADRAAVYRSLERYRSERQDTRGDFYPRRKLASLGLQICTVVWIGWPPQEPTVAREETGPVPALVSGGGRPSPGTEDGAG